MLEEIKEWIIYIHILGYLLFPILLWVAHKLVGWAISNVDGGMWTTNMLHWLNSVIEYDAHGCKPSWDAFS